MPIFDPLFEMLAQAKAQPSHAYREATAAMDIPGEAISGYETGLKAKSDIQNLQMMNTKLGDIWNDPSQIPYGLGPQHTLRDLMTIAPTMQNYIPSGFANSVARSYGPSGGGQPSSNVPPPPPPPQPSPVTPSPTPGVSALDTAEGAGAGQGATFAPGSPTGASPPPVIPAGGISKTAFQLLEPALKAGQEERQFQERQGAEESRFERAQQNEKNRTMAGETAKIAPSLTEAGTIQDDINALLPLYKGYQPIPFIGTALANLTAKSGSSTFGTQTMQTGKQIAQIVPALSAKVNYLLNKRFNSGEAAMLQQQVIPNPSDDEHNARQKIANLQRLTAVMQGGDINALQMVASSIAGRPVSPVLPSSARSLLSVQKTGNHEADQAITRINASGLTPQEKQARVSAVMARLNR